MYDWISHELAIFINLLGLPCGTRLKKNVSWCQNKYYFTEKINHHAFSSSHYSSSCSSKIAGCRHSIVQPQLVGGGNSSDNSIIYGNDDNNNNNSNNNNGSDGAMSDGLMSDVI